MGARLLGVPFCCGRGWRCPFPPPHPSQASVEVLSFERFVTLTAAAHPNRTDPKRRSSVSHERPTEPTVGEDKDGYNDIDGEGGGGAQKRCRWNLR